jgi:hypothetical protein
VVCEQRGFEARMGQKLEAASAALRQQLEASVERLETKMDRIVSRTSACSSAECMQHRLPHDPTHCPACLGQKTDIKIDFSQTEGFKQSAVHVAQLQVEEQQEHGRLNSLEKRLDRIAIALGVKPVGEEDDNRKRMKVKLKSAIESDKRNRVRNIESKPALWLDYIFGICKADQRYGKRGSRFIDCVQSIDVFCLS